MEPFSRPETNSLIAEGWSPLGVNSELSLNSDISANLRQLINTIQWQRLNFILTINIGLTMQDLIIKRFEQPDKIINFNHGKFEIIQMDGLTIGRATYEPGWKWSVDANPLAGTRFCEVEHLGMVISGSATVAFEDEDISILKPGDIFYVSSKPHDSWVVGDEAYISLHFLGADKYIQRKELK